MSCFATLAAVRTGNAFGDNGRGRHERIYIIKSQQWGNAVVE